MSDKPREWGNVARAQRDAAAEAAVDGIRLLNPLILGERLFSDTEVLRRQAGALICLQKIARLMSEAGAPIRGIDL